MFAFLKQKPGFYKQVVLLAMPIVLQNLITSALGMADTFMVGMLGEVPMAAVTLANIPLFAVQMFIFGVQSGSSVLVSQYWGKQEMESINRVLGVALWVVLLVSSLFAMTATSVLVDLIAAMYTFPSMDPMLAAIFGGVSLGVSLGMIFSKGATTGGTDLTARLLKLPFAWLPMGKLLMVVDLTMLLSVSLVFRSMESAMYGMISLYISTLVMDGVLYGLDQSKVAYIVTTRPQEIAAEIDRQMDRGATFLHGEGSFSREEKLVLMCAFKQKQIVPLKALVHELDPEAFLIVCDAHEVLGQGFRRYQKDDI